MGMASTQFVRGKATLPDLSCKSTYLLVSSETFRPLRPLRRHEVVRRSTSMLTKYSLPVDDYGALEPHISGQIMELHHSKHHQTYVNGLNSAIETLTEAEAKGDSAKAASVAPLLNFHGGGHVNHTLFWENLAPANKDGGGEPEGDLKVCGN